MIRNILIIGGGPVGHALATRLDATGHYVNLVAADERTIKQAQDTGINTYKSTLESPTTEDDLSAHTVLVATASDARNLLLAGGAPTAFNASRVIALLNDPHNQPAFDDANIETIHVPETLADAASTRIMGEDTATTKEHSADRMRMRE